MKILHINTYSSGGAANAAIRLHEAFLNRGFDSSILFLRGSRSVKNGFYFKQTPELNEPKGFGWRLMNYARRIFETVFPQRFFRSKKKTSKKTLPPIEIFTSPITPFSVEKHPLVQESDIIQLHWISDFINLKTFFNEIDKPVFWYFHDMNPLLGGIHYDGDIEILKNYPLIKKEKEFNILKDEIFSCFPNLEIQCNSSWLEELTRKSSRFQNVRSISTINCSIDTNKFFPVEKKLSRKALNLPTDKVMILFGAEDISNRRKGFDILLACLENWGASDILVCTFGKSQGIKLKNEKIEIREFGKIFNLDLQRLIYSSADIFVIPSRQEAFGQTALEALACGTPSVGFKTGGIPDIIETGVNGLIADVISSTSLKASLEQLVYDVELRKEVTSAAHASVTGKFSPEHQVDSFLKIYENTNKYGREKQLK